MNVRGETIHSFFGFLPDVTLQKVKKIREAEEEKNLYKKLEVIVIDEISMVRADLLDCVDRFLRLNGPDRNLAFGGVQMVFIGDLYQLPPVVGREERDLFVSHYESPYFFSSPAFEESDMIFIELEKIYRQKDAHFIRLLNSIRNRSCTASDLAQLNERFMPEFQPEQDDFYISLTSTNELADRINRQQIGSLHGKSWNSKARIIGDIRKDSFPAPIDLELKVGAQVMLLNNDSAGRWVNGTIGKVTGFETGKEDDAVLVELGNSKTVKIVRNTWEVFRFALEDSKIVSDVVGVFTQYPLRLAFAITIHKSQGKTFEKVIIDIGRGTFAHGQMYVALSRCTSMEGLVLRQKIQPAHVRLDYAVVKFLTRYQYDQAKQSLSLDDRIALIEGAIEYGKTLRMVYLKGKDEKSERMVRPVFLGQMEYVRKPYLGMEAYCLLRKEARVFNVERILELEAIEDGDEECS